mmetsp:Transcript_33541/g.81575  ORF Transcript_33541/g.81575 Transcript_33541/m.81575 type:complete len:236 (+) Transcript_33541:3277-3984(+)
MHADVRNEGRIPAVKEGQVGDEVFVDLYAHLVLQRCRHLLEHSLDVEYRDTIEVVFVEAADATLQQLVQPSLADVPIYNLHAVVRKLSLQVKVRCDVCDRTDDDAEYHDANHLHGCDKQQFHRVLGKHVAIADSGHGGERPVHRHNVLSKIISLNLVPQLRRQLVLSIPLNPVVVLVLCESMDAEPKASDQVGEEEDLREDRGEPDDCWIHVHVVLEFLDEAAELKKAEELEKPN